MMRSRQGAAAAASNVFKMVRASRRSQVISPELEVMERWAGYSAADMPMSHKVDESEQAQAARFVFMAKHISKVESDIYRATVWLRVPTSVGNPFGIGAEFSGRSLPQAVDAAIEFINLSK
jgi:hypothetical protein